MILSTVFPEGFWFTMIFVVFFWCFIMVCWPVACAMGVVKDFPKVEERPVRPSPEIVEEEPEQDPEWFGTWNDRPDDTWFDSDSESEPVSEPEPEPVPVPVPVPQTDPKIIEEVIAGLQNFGFKKKDAKATVLRACEGRVFEDHESLIAAALDKSNL